MTPEEDAEQKRILAAALENAEAILIARQRAELAQQRAWFEVTLASIADAVVTTDAQASITFLNPVAEEMTGWRDAQARGLPLADVVRVINEDSRAPAECPIYKVLASGNAVESGNNIALIARDGREVSIEPRAAPFRDAQGNLAGAVMVFPDVSRLRRAERTLRANEERLSAMFAQAAVGIAVAGLDGRILDANYKFCSIVGHTPDQLRELTIRQLTWHEDRTVTEDRVRQLLAGDIPSYELEKRFVHAEGHPVWISTSVTLLRAEGGEAAQFIGVIHDISERRHAEEVRSRLAAVVESSDDAIISKTLDGIITTWNPGAQRIFGYAADEVIGKSITLLIPDELHAEEPEILARLRSGQRIDHFETARVRKDGQKIQVSLTVSPINDSRGRIIGASKIARDITRQKEVEAELHATAQRKDEFLATLAHELRNPLAPIRQAAALAGAAQATEEQKRWSQEVIGRQVRHMSALLDDLLDISRISRGSPELRERATLLGAVVENAIETARPLIDEKQHRLLVEMSEEPVEFAADPLRLSQVLSNLLTNAAKYTDPNGTIRLRAFADAQTVTIAIADTGVGLSKESLNDVFAMFSQVKSPQDRSEGGLGIGLALARALVQLHGGTLTAHSEGLGHGSEFTVSIPRRAAPAAPKTTAPIRTAAIRRHVLIADDNRDAADSLALLLEMEGHEVTVVHDGRQALDSIEKLQPEVALLDIGMPELDGYEVARRVRQRPSGRGITLIAVTGWGQETDRARTIEAGFNLHLTKPVEPERLIDLLRAGAPL